MTNLYVKPAKEGVIVRLPWRPSQPIPAEGMNVPDTSFIRRRIARGDLVRCQPTKKAAPTRKPQPLAAVAKADEEES